MTEVMPGIYQLKIPIPDNPLEYTNTYLVQGDNGYLLIDTGWDNEEAFNSLKRQLTEIGIDFDDISQIVVTHIHADHCGLAGKIKSLSNAKLALHYLEKDFIESRGHMDMRKVLQQTKQWFHINGEPADESLQSQTAWVGTMKFIPPLPDIMLSGGEIISVGSFNLQIIWTPGHSPGHICLYEPSQRILFSGDHILPIITPNIRLDSPSSSNPLRDFINSLNAVKRLDVNLVLPGHEHFFTNLQQRVEEIIQHHIQRNSEILETIKTEVKTAYQISTEITWMPEFGGVNFQDLALMDRRMAIMETLAHVESMRFDGKVDKLFRDNIIYYRIIR